MAFAIWLANMIEVIKEIEKSSVPDGRSLKLLCVALIANRRLL